MMPIRAPAIAILLTIFLGWSPQATLAQPAAESDEAQIEIVEGKNRVVYEYRQNGKLLIIKVVPKKGLAYYMVPGDGSPHYEGLDNKRRLYPQWVIVEW